MLAFKVIGQVNYDSLPGIGLQFRVQVAALQANQAVANGVPVQGQEPAARPSRELVQRRRGASAATRQESQPAIRVKPPRGAA